MRAATAARVAARISALAPAQRCFGSVPILSVEDVVNNFNSMMPEQCKQQYSFYSSSLGGIVTDPQLMVVPVDDHLVHRGHGVFDTANVSNGKVYGLDFHLDRLLLSADRAKIPLPKNASSKQELKDIILQTVAATKRTGGVFVRYWLSSGRGNFSVSPSNCETSNFYCVVHEDEPGHKSGHPGIKAAMVDVPLKPKLLANMKSNNYLLNALVAMEAEGKGADLGIQTDPSGNVTESSVSCIGIIDEDSKLIVPPFDLTLASTTLVRTFAMIGEGGLEDGCISGYEQRELTVDELANAKELISFGGGWCVPVIQFDGKDVGDGKPGNAYASIVSVLEDDFNNSEFIDDIPAL